VNLFPDGQLLDLVDTHWFPFFSPETKNKVPT
jgi:hypothetical protein